MRSPEQTLFVQNPYLVALQILQGIATANINIESYKQIPSFDGLDVLLVN